MYERILVPLDGSGLAEAVLPHVEELATKFGSSVILVQAVVSQVEAFRESASANAPNVGIDVAKRRMQAEQESAESYLAGVKSDLAARGIDVSTRVIPGPAAGVILDEAEGVKASLICMATHGRGGLGRLVFGSVADQVLRNAETPVLLVRAS